MGVWFRIECGFFGIMFLLNVRVARSLEGAVQYFIFQCLGSLFVFISFLILVARKLLVLMFFNFFILGFLIKLGLFPFHFWVPSVIRKISWMNCFFIGWVQKVGPIFFLCNLGAEELFYRIFGTFGMLTALVGGLAGINTVEYRSIIAYSSLVQSGWLVILACSGVQFLCYIYLFTYGVMLFLVVIELHYSNLSSVRDHYTFSECERRGFSGFIVVIHVASLSGMPPLLGGGAKTISFFPIWDFDRAAAIVLVLGSAFSTYFYLSLLVQLFLVGGQHVSFLNFRSVGRFSFFLRFVVCLFQFFCGFFLLRFISFF